MFKRDFMVTTEVVSRRLSSRINRIHFGMSFKYIKVEVVIFAGHIVYTNFRSHTNKRTTSMDLCLICGISELIY